MKTILLNGSPKVNTQNSASYFLAKSFASGMQQPCEIYSIRKENRQELLEKIAQFDRIILITPNYIHTIPGDTLDFRYELPMATGTQSLGFVIQCGFTEGSENEYMSRFFQNFAARLHYDYMGTVMKGECGGYAIFPNMFKKLGQQFAEFGTLYEQTGKFDEGYCTKYASPYTLSKFQVWLLNATAPIGESLGWNKILKANNAFDKRSDMPYLNL